MENTDYNLLSGTISLLNQLGEDYTAKILAIAKDAFNKHIKPFCIKRGWDFHAEDGKWWLGLGSLIDGRYTRSTASMLVKSFDFKSYELVAISADKELQGIFDILMTKLSVECLQSSNLGALMPNFTTR